MAPLYFRIVGFSEILLFCRKIFGLLPLLKIEVLNFIEKSLSLAPSILQVPRCICLELSNVFKYKLPIFVFDSIHGNLPICFSEFYLLDSSVHRIYGTRETCRSDLFLS